MDKKLLMVGIHKETVDEKGKVITPASIIKIYEDNSNDCFGDKLIASCEQIYARRNKKINYNKLSIDDFKGTKGLSESFYYLSHLHDYIEELMSDEYRIVRVTKHKENEMADDLFKTVVQYGMRNASKVMNF